MNDNELSSMVRESVADVRSSTPVDQIISRGRAVRARRRVPAAAGALAAAGAAALVVTTLTPSGHPAPTVAGKAGHDPAVVRLAAWTVARQADGDIGITIRQLRHPAQLQATLRADGVPAHVSFSGNPGTACKPRAVTGDTALSIYRFLERHGSDVITIDPSVLPSGVGLSISAVGQRLPSGFPGAIGIGTVYTSPECTG
jgi:hypothetical protein